MLAAHTIWATDETIADEVQNSAVNSPAAFAGEPHAAVTNGTLITIAGKKRWLWRTVDQEG
jgi:transposase-like protein